MAGGFTLVEKIRISLPRLLRVGRRVLGCCRSVASFTLSPTFVIGEETKWGRRLLRNCGVVALLLVVLSSTTGAREAVGLSAYPQKVRTFYKLDDTNLPAALLTNAVALPVAGGTAVGPRPG